MFFFEFDKDCLLKTSVGEKEGNRVDIEVSKNKGFKGVNSFEGKKGLKFDRFSSNEREKQRNRVLFTLFHLFDEFAENFPQKFFFLFGCSQTTKYNLGKDQSFEIITACGSAKFSPIVISRDVLNMELFGTERFEHFFFVERFSSSDHLLRST